jgi:CubicO group peptidase (beta-lactamase class C family)
VDRRPVRVWVTASDGTTAVAPFRGYRAPDGGRKRRTEPGETVPETDARKVVITDPAEVGVDAKALAALIERCHREVDEGVLPSCQVAVAANDQLIAYETIGDAAPDSRYTMFSCTKAVVIGAFWLLLGDGSISLDQRVAELIPEFGSNGKDIITVRQLMLHESGFPSAPMPLVPSPSREERLERFAVWRLNWEPGTRFEYHATSAHWVIAELIERLSGVEYKAFIRQRLLDPLGLDRLQVGVPPDEQGDINELESRGEPPTSAELEAALGIPGLDLEMMQGEVTEAALLSFNRSDIRALGVPGGGGVSTAADLALYYQALLHNPDDLWNSGVLRAGTREVHGRLPDPLMKVPSNRALGTVIAGDPPNSAFRGFGYTVSPRAFGHGGAGGQIAFADPESDISFCYLTNGLDANVLRQSRRTASIASRVGPLTADAG